MEWEVHFGSRGNINFFKKLKKFYFFDDIDETKFLNLKKRKIYQMFFLIISKSGNTIETQTNTFFIGYNKNSKKYYSFGKNSNYHIIYQKLNLFFIDIKFVGGRYSVLSETGIIPAYFGINIIKPINLLNF